MELFRFLIDIQPHASPLNGLQMDPKMHSIFASIFDRFLVDSGVQIGAEKPLGSDLRANKKCIGKVFVTRTGEEPKTRWLPTLSRVDPGPREGIIAIRD